jgi:hypothetical protein
MSTSQYKIKVVKETILDLDSDLEAEQIAEFLADREVRQKAFGNSIFIYSDYEKVLV